MQASCCSQGKPAPLTLIIPNECMASSHETEREAAEGSPEQGAAGTASWSRGAAEEEEGWPGCSGPLPAPHSPAARIPAELLARPCCFGNTG